MSVWIKMERALRDDPRVLKMARDLRNADVTLHAFSRAALVTLVVGCLCQFWWYADAHIREDDTLDVGTDEIDELVGLRGFSQVIPSDWLERLDTDRVKLPGFHTHNGLEARKKALTQKRVARHRERVTLQSFNGEPSCNAAALQTALPDKTRQDQDKTRQDSKNCPAAAPPAVKSVPREAEWFLDFKLAYPERAGDQNWHGAKKAANARMAEGHTPDEFLAGARRYAAYIAASGKGRTEYVKQAATFLGPGKPFLEPWTPPPSKAEQRLTGNLTAADEFMRLTEPTT